VGQILNGGWLHFAQTTPAFGLDPGREASPELRRWLVSQTLSGPDSVVSLRWGLACWGGGLLALLLLAIAAQGPSRALGQLLDAKGLADLLSAAGLRLRRAGRLLVVLSGALVLAWTGAQSLAFFRDARAIAVPERVVQAQSPAVLMPTPPVGASKSTVVRPNGAPAVPTSEDELEAAAEQAAVEEAVAQTARAKASTRLGGPGARAREQAVLAAMGPWGSLCGLADLTALAILAGLLMFQFSSDQSGRRRNLADLKVGSRSMIAWSGALLYALARIVAWAAGREGLPLRGCIPGEGLLIPLVMLVADGLLLAWVLVELRDAGLAGPDGAPSDLGGVALLLPASVACCFLLLPGRAVGTAIWQWQAPPKPVAAEETGYTVYPPATGLPAPTAPKPAPPLISAEDLLCGLVASQGASVIFCGLLGVAAWGRGGILGLLPNYWRLLRGQGGRLVALAIAAGGAAGILAWLANRAMLSLPPHPWTLFAADAYSHYGSVAVALVFAAGVVELGSRILPRAALAPRSVLEAGEEMGRPGEMRFLDEIPSA
jgi:hypothetical protein